MKLWIDDVRTAPDGYVWCKSVNEAKIQIWLAEFYDAVELLDMDHDAGDEAQYGGDYIKLLDWLEQVQHKSGKTIPYKFHIHSMNPIGVENMRRIIVRNGWKEV